MEPTKVETAVAPSEACSSASSRGLPGVCPSVAPLRAARKARHRSVSARVRRALLNLSAAWQSRQDGRGGAGHG
eukprot:CAMPEP_0183359022 /NCGR_PEP_ID=MMETSP0164_2-20130417/51020_1 /TAXON_ID=221442 /ORGANISM="Coccolithus pelagicus ssp braarudi, Strain PLY182g" /LENGTH=73 /DNA_ID=CAMNT_0025533041 /DNA_START=286 /DNA_END=504 /DNA_ORIENTATION=+